MDKEILNKFLTEMGDLLKTAKDFTVEQAPQVVKEVLKYNAVVDMMWIVIGLAACFVSYRFFKHIRALVADDSDWAPMYIL